MRRRVSRRLLSIARQVGRGLDLALGATVHDLVRAAHDDDIPARQARCTERARVGVPANHALSELFRHAPEDAERERGGPSFHLYNYPHDDLPRDRRRWLHWLEPRRSIAPARRHRPHPRRLLVRTAVEHRRSPRQARRRRGLRSSTRPPFARPCRVSRSCSTKPPFRRFLAPSTNRKPRCSWACRAPPWCSTSRARSACAACIFAASSSAYGDTPTLPKVETMTPHAEVALRDLEARARAAHDARSRRSTAWRRSASATSTSSARGRIRRVSTRRSFRTS